MIDRDLEDFLAEKVMGWHRERVPYTGEWWRNSNDYGVQAADYWHPLSEIGQAWQLIDKLSEYPESHVFVVCQPHDGNMASCMVFKGGARAYGPLDVFFELKGEDDFSKSRYPGIEPAIRVAMKTPAEAISVAAAMIKGWSANYAQEGNE